MSYKLGHEKYIFSFTIYYFISQISSLPFFLEYHLIFKAFKVLEIEEYRYQKKVIKKKI